jgi:hypothetical protein
MPSMVQIAVTASAGRRSASPGNSTGRTEMDSGMMTAAPDPVINEPVPRQ